MFVLERVQIIAEAGVNHDGDLGTAYRLIDIAAECGADYVKFQSFKASSLASPFAAKAPYQLESEIDQQSQHSMLTKLELSVEDHLKLISHCDRRGIKFLSSAFDVEGLHLLSRLDVNLIKIPSGEITHVPYLKSASELGLPILLSTGMSDYQEIGIALDILRQNHSEVSLLHCNSAYPTPYHDVNLRAMVALEDDFDVQIGLSDHSCGIEVPIAAVALGAKFIEKHFTYDQKAIGPDHASSLSPLQLNDMVSAIRNIEKAIGERDKLPTRSELQNRPLVRKAIFAKKDIRKGDKFCDDNMIGLRPESAGLPVSNWEDVEGLVAKRDFSAGEPIKL